MYLEFHGDYDRNYQNRITIITIIAAAYPAAHSVAGRELIIEIHRRIVDTLTFGNPVALHLNFALIADSKARV